MELKILALPSGNGKVYSTTDKLADYIKLGYVDTGETIEVEVTDPSKEIVEMLLEDNIVTHLRYKGDNEWRAIAGGSGGSEVTVYADLATIKAVDTTSLTSGTQAYVNGFGLYELTKNLNVVCDGFDSFKSDDGLSKYIRIKKESRIIDFEKASNLTNATEINGCSYSYFENEDSFYIQSTNYPDDNLFTSSYLSGKNKKIYVEAENGVNSTAFHIFMGANGHAADGAGYEAYDAYIADSSSGSIMLYKNSGATPTKTWKAQQTTGGDFNQTLDKCGYKITKVNDIINVDLYSMRKGSRVRTLWFKEAAINTIAGVKNSLCVSATSQSFGKLFTSLIAEDIDTSNNKLTNIVCLGDSLTSTGTIYVNSAYLWTEKMAYYTRKRNALVLNAGVSGNTIADMTARLAADVTPKFVTGMNNIIVLLAGTNDFNQGANATTTYNNLTALAGTLKTAGWKVAVCTITNVFAPYVADPNTVNGYITSYNASIMASSGVFDYKIDLNTALKDGSTGLTNVKYIRAIDGVHYLASAQNIIAKEVLKGINLD